MVYLRYSRYTFNGQPAQSFIYLTLTVVYINGPQR